MPYYDHDKDYPFAAFITNLGKYNEGELVGEWVKFPTTAEELKEVFKRIGIGQKALAVFTLKMTGAFALGSKKISSIL